LKPAAVFPHLQSLTRKYTLENTPPHSLIILIPANNYC
jgi:hypothetical protein